MSYKINSHYFLKQQNLCSNYKERSMNYLKLCCLCTLPQSRVHKGMLTPWDQTPPGSGCVKWEKGKVPSPQSENRRECKIRREETWGSAGQAGDPLAERSQTNQTSACSTSQLTSKLTPWECKAVLRFNALISTFVSIYVNFIRKLFITICLKILCLQYKIVS